MQKKEFILYVIIGVLTFILFRQCGSLPSGPKKGVDEVISSDTVKVFILGKPDTVFIDRIYHYRDTIPKYIFAEVDTATGDTLKTYLTAFSDSLIEATITSKVKGALLSTDLVFTPKFPRYITRVDTFKQSIETVKARNNYGLYIGGVLGGSSERFSVTPSLMLKTPKKLYFTAGYDLINKTYHVGAFTEIRF